MKTLSKISTKTPFGVLTWQGYDARTLPKTREFYKKLSDVTDNGFGIEMRFDTEPIKRTIATSTHAYILYNEQEKLEIVGFAFLKVIHDEFGSIVELSKVCLAKQVQKLGQSSILRNAIISDFNVAILTAKSQNSSVMHLIR